MGGSGGGVTSIVAGTGVTLDPTTGVGDVTINAGVNVYLPLTGGTLTGQLEMKNDISFTGSGRRIKFKDNTYNSLLFTCADGTDYFGLDSQNKEEAMARFLAETPNSSFSKSEFCYPRNPVAQY